MVREIVAIARDRADEVQLGNPKYMDEINKVIQDLKDTLRANKDLVALSAPQIGENMRIFCIKFARGDIRAFINPLIITRKGIHLSRESQIGYGGQEYIVPRHNEIDAAYQTPVGSKDVNAFMEAVGEVFQQMIEIMDGVLIEDYGLIILPEFDKASDKDKQEVIDMYLNNLEEKSKNIDEKINSDSELSRMSKSIDFMTKLSLGKIETANFTEEEIKKYKEEHKDE